MTYQKRQYVIKQYLCNRCYETFDEPDIGTVRVHTVVGDMDRYATYEDVPVCPFCGSDDIGENIFENEEEEL